MNRFFILVLCVSTTVFGEPDAGLPKVKRSPFVPIYTSTYNSPAPYVAPAQVYAAPAPYVAPYTAPPAQYVTPAQVYAAPQPYVAPTYAAAPQPYVAPATYNTYQTSTYTSYGSSYTSNLAAYPTTYAQWCTDTCTMRSRGKRSINPILSPNDSGFNNQNNINYNDENCVCYEQVPDYQGGDLCSYNTDYYNACDTTCKGDGDNKLIDIYGNPNCYIDGTCINDKCYCSVRPYDNPMKPSF